MIVNYIEQVQPQTVTSSHLNQCYIENIPKPMHSCSYAKFKGVLNTDNSVTFYNIRFDTIQDAIAYLTVIHYSIQTLE